MRKLIIALLVAAACGGIAQARFFSGGVATGGGSPPKPQISSIGVSSTQFNAQAGNANTTVATLSVASTLGATFAGTYGLTSSGAGCSGSDSTSFAISGNALKIGTSDLTTARTYNICVVAIDSQYSNSPYTQAVSLQGVAGCVTGQPTPCVTVAQANPVAGSTITITYNPEGATVSGSDFLQLNYTPPQESCNVPPASNGSIAASPPIVVPIPNATPGAHTATMRIPMAPSDVPMIYRVEYWGDAIANSAHACQGGSNAGILSFSPSFITPATLSPYNYPAAPSYITYPPPGWPASPNEIVTVCQSGCQFNNIDDASWYLNWQDTNKDWIKIDVTSGTYNSIGRFGAFGQQNNACGSGGCPKHVWLYGHGTTRPIITCSATSTLSCAGVLGPLGWHTVIDNVDVQRSVRAGANSAAFGGIGCVSNNTSDPDTMLVRNSYVHDGGQGTLGGGECAYTATYQNVHYARFGGPVGPAHDLYMNDLCPGHFEGRCSFPAIIADGHLIIDHSVFELVDTGHAIKSHANRVDINCSQLTTGVSEDFSGSQALDLDGGGGQVTITNSMIAGGAYYYNSQANSSWFMEFGGDKSAWDGDQPSQFIVASNSYIFNDRGQFMLGGNAPMQPSQPYTWSNNVFVGRWDDGFTGAACGGSIPCTTPYSELPGAGGGARVSDLNFGCPAASVPAGQDCGPLRDTGTASTSGNLFFSGRAAARAHNWPSSASPLQDLPTRTDQGGSVYTSFPYDPKYYPMPPACTDPVGNVQWPL